MYYAKYNNGWIRWTLWKWSYKRNEWDNKAYDIYEGPGQNWIVEEEDYIPTKKKTNYIKKLIKEEARFLFGKTPTFTIQVEDDKFKQQAEEINNYINEVHKNN